MSQHIPWDAPSRYGFAGLTARRALRRALRPLTVRIEAEQQSLRATAAALDARQQALEQSLAEATRRISELGAEAELASAHAAAEELVVNELLTSDLPPGVRRRRGAPERSNWAICSLATGDAYRALLARSALSYERYARRWGWDVVLSTEDLTGGRPAPWGKIPFLCELLAQYEWVLWIDADVVIVDLEADIRREIREGKDLHLVEHRLDRQYTGNSGVMLIRSGDWARAFLDEVWAMRQHVEHHWWENAAVLELLGYGLEPARLVRPTKWLARTQFIDLRFNSVEIDRADPPAFVHRGFYDAATRTRQVTDDLACVLGRAHPLTAGWARPARPITSIADVRRREELPVALNAMGLTGTGLELGVRKGHYSEQLLKLWQGNRLISVDTWTEAPAQEYVDISNVTQAEHDGNEAETRRRLARFGPRSTVWRMDGVRASRSLHPGVLDFVYLDARHDRASVTEDLSTWWPLLRPGGVLAGHDYLDGELAASVFGVRSAVDEFLGALGLAVHATVDDAPWPSWAVVKPGAVHPTVRRPGPSHTVSSFDEVLTWLSSRERFTVVQIGACIGETINDPLHAFLSEQLPLHPRAQAILVEPVTEYFEWLRDTYRGWPQIRFENVAIAESEDERGFYPIDVDRVRCVTLESMLDSHRIVEPDLLQIDAEGYDEILRTLDFSRIRPRFINYERVPLQDDEPARRAMLMDAGYELYDWGQDTLCVATPLDPS